MYHLCIILHLIMYLRAIKFWPCSGGIKSWNFYWVIVPGYSICRTIIGLIYYSYIRERWGFQVLRGEKLNDRSPRLKWYRTKISISTCLNSSERRALDLNGWGPRFNTHWGNILLLDFLFSHAKASDALDLLPILCVCKNRMTTRASNNPIVSFRDNYYVLWYHKDEIQKTFFPYRKLIL